MVILIHALPTEAYEKRMHGEGMAVMWWEYGWFALAFVEFPKLSGMRLLF